MTIKFDEIWNTDDNLDESYPIHQQIIDEINDCSFELTAKADDLGRTKVAFQPSTWTNAQARYLASVGLDPSKSLPRAKTLRALGKVTRPLLPKKITDAMMIWSNYGWWTVDEAAEKTHLTGPFYLVPAGQNCRSGIASHGFETTSDLNTYLNRAVRPYKKEEKITACSWIRMMTASGLEFAEIKEKLPTMGFKVADGTIRTQRSNARRSQ